MEHRILKMKNAKVREEGGRRYLEGYFAVFNEPYQVFDGWVETIERGAFARYLSTGEDTKVLWNHDSNIVLGSTENGTATLREDEIGLWGSVEINEGDQEAVNAHARVSRGDVSGCSPPALSRPTRPRAYPPGIRSTWQRPERNISRHKRKKEQHGARK